MIIEPDRRSAEIRKLRAERKEKLNKLNEF